MSKVEQLIQELCPGGVERTNLGSFSEIKTGRGITKSDAEVGGIYPIISGGIDPMGYYHLSNRNRNTITISRVGANAGYVNFITTDFYLNDKCFSIIPLDHYLEKLDIKYLFFTLKFNEGAIKELQSEGGVPTINTHKISSIEIPLPPLPIQEEIVRILDTFTEAQANLEQELELRKKQYDYYLDKLYGSNKDEIEKQGESDGISIVTLSELGTLTRGKRFVRDDVRESGQPCIHYGDMYTYYGTKAYQARTFLDRDFPKKMRYAKPGDVVIVGAGENDTDIGVGLAWFGDEPAVVHDACYILEHNQNPMYISYYLRSGGYHQQIRKHVSDGKICSISADGIGKSIIAIPSKECQQEIVSILDKFESAIQTLEEELALRKKQYEYYREKLLTFKSN